jgi:PAS domain S-box-containing protein
MEPTAEIKRLQSCINDLISVLALPAIWSGSEPSNILGTLLDVLLTMLRLDFAYARLSDTTVDPKIEMIRVGDQRKNAIPAQHFGEALESYLKGDQSHQRRTIPNPAGEGEVSVASFALGLHDKVSILVVGSRRMDFPTQVEQLLVRVATNQAGIGLEEARRSGEQKRIAEMLEQRVAERTRQLTALNDELRRRDAYLAEAQRLSHTGSFGWKPSTGEIIWSDESFRIFQYDRTTKPSIELILRRVHPEDAALFQQTVNRASQDRKDFEHQYRLVMPDASVKFVHVVVRALSDESGSVEFVGAVMDVTAAKEAQDRIRLMIDAVPALIWTARADGHLDSISQRWLDYAGIDIQTLGSGELGERTVHRDDIEQLRSKWRAAVEEGNPFEAEMRVRRFDGEYRWFLSRAFPLRDGSGHILRWYGNDTDIDDRKQAEERLRRSEGYLAEAQRLSHTGSWAFNLVGPLYWSEENFRIWGFDPQNGLPSRATILNRIHPEDRERVLETAVNAINEKRDYAVDFRVVHPDGTVKHIHGLGRPVFSGSGELIEFVGTQLDVTERKRAEEERERLRQAQADLAHINRVTTMGELTASLAHEIKQPITAAVTNARTCLRWLDRDAPEIAEAREAASRLVSDVTRASDIISRISFLFKKGAQQHELVDVNELAREMIALLHSETTRYSISIRSELTEDLPHVMADRVQLQQVFMNLMLNGIESMSEGGGALELTIRSERTQNGQLLISVSDTGSGLPQKPEEIFNAFFTTKPQGTGMGLPISRSIIESHGGRLWADSNSGRGASFHFTLPVEVESRHAAASSDTPLSAYP